MFRKIFWLLIIIFIAIQFFHPAKNQSKQVLATDIEKMYPTSAEAHTILAKACYDCHSNNTVYPWYNNIQPVAWWLNNHIEDGKWHVNFSDFGSSPVRWQYKKLESTIKEVKEGGMPLNSYTWIHKNAILTDQEKQTLLNWAQAIRDSIKANYPADSLKMHPDEERFKSDD